MRSYGFFDLDRYIELYELDYSPSDFFEDSENYRARKCDFCEAEIGVLAEYAGITKRSAYDALENLLSNITLLKMMMKEAGKYFCDHKSGIRQTILIKK